MYIVYTRLTLFGMEVLGKLNKYLTKLKAFCKNPKAFTEPGFGRVGWDFDSQ